MMTTEQALWLQECEAWECYLKATKHAWGIKYREIEPWAWAKLNQRLLAIEARRRAAA